MKAETHEAIADDRVMLERLQKPVTLQAVEIAARAETQARAALTSAVAAARRDGVTWTAIATALGVTRQAVWQRFRHLDAAGES